MTIQECYQLCGGDFDDAMTRMMKPERIAKFFAMFARDTSFATLKETLAARDYEQAFRASHTLKGVCANLSLTRLFKSSQALCESLRPGNPRPDDAVLDEMFIVVEKDYNQVIETINAFKA